MKDFLVDYHYYLHRDLPNDRLFRIQKDELKQNDIFQVSKDEENWKVMPWGVQALNN